MKEEVVCFGEEHGLVGIVAEPDASAATCTVGAIVLNSGWIHRVGPHRMNVRIARRLARAGMVAARFDLSGIGDSPVRSDHLPLEECAVPEVRDVMGQLQRSYGLEQFVLVGNCSGASLAYRAAIEDPRVAGTVLINIDTFDTSQKTQSFMTKQGLAEHYWKRALRDPKRWLRLFTGKSSYARIAGVLKFQLSELASREGSLSEVSRKVRSDMHRLIQRSVRILFLLSEGDPSGDHIRTLMGERLQSLDGPGSAKIVSIPGSDHLFTLRRSQDELIDTLAEWTLESGFSDEVGRDRRDAVGVHAS